MTSPKHPKLIQANIALYAGAYAESRRLLDEYRAQEGIPREHGALALWLGAQAEEDPEERLRHLQVLVAQGAPDSIYVQMAQQILTQEAEHETKMRAARSTALLPGVKTWQVIAFAAAAFALIAILVVLNPATNAPAATATSLPTTPAPTPAPPDRSRPLDPAQYSGRYPQGILQLLRLEDPSERVIDPDTGAGVSPVAGARFYALQIGFECRSGVCDQPPEANLALQIDANTRIPPRGDVVIAGDSPLAPVALGRVTIGWVIFEIPVISDVQALIISARDNQAFDPISISLRESS